MLNAQLYTPFAACGVGIGIVDTLINMDIGLAKAGFNPSKLFLVNKVRRYTFLLSRKIKLVQILLMTAVSIRYNSENKYFLIEISIV